MLRIVDEASGVKVWGKIWVQRRSWLEEGGEFFRMWPAKPHLQLWQSKWTRIALVWDWKL